jgi:hypothetical protein
VIAQCYALGEYLAVRTVNEQTYAAWGDDRRSIHEPENKFDPLSDQTHPQGDVFFQDVTPDLFACQLHMPGLASTPAPAST